MNYVGASILRVLSQRFGLGKYCFRDNSSRFHGDAEMVLRLLGINTLNNSGTLSKRRKRTTTNFDLTKRNLCRNFLERLSETFGEPNGILAQREIDCPSLQINVLRNRKTKMKRIRFSRCSENSNSVAADFPGVLVAPERSQAPGRPT